MEGTSLPVSLMREPPKKLPTPTPKVVMARPVTFWLARRVTVSRAVQQSHQQRAQQGAQHGDAHRQQAVHLRRRDGLLIEKRPDDAADAAHIHDAGDAQIQVAGFLRQDLAGAAVQQGDALHDGPGKERCKIKKHSLCLLLSAACAG